MNCRRTSLPGHKAPSHFFLSVSRFYVEVDGRVQSLRQFDLGHPGAHRADRVGETDLAAVDADTELEFEGLGDVLARDRTKQSPFLPGTGGQVEVDGTEALGQILRLLPLMLEAALA